MPVTVPPAVSSTATVKLKWVPTIAGIATPVISLATDINAAGALDLECYLKENFTPDVKSETVEDQRMCSKQMFSAPGTYTYTIAELVMVYDPQNAAAIGNKAYATLMSGASGFLVARWGLDVDTVYVVAQKVDIYPVTLGRRVKVAPELNSQLKFKIPPFVTGPVIEDLTISA